MWEKKKRIFVRWLLNVGLYGKYNNDIVFNKNIYFTFYEGIVNRKLLAEVVAREIVAKGEIQAKHLEVEVIFAKKKNLRWLSESLRDV